MLLEVQAERFPPSKIKSGDEEVGVGIDVLVGIAVGPPGACVAVCEGAAVGVVEQDGGVAPARETNSFGALVPSFKE